ncbi:2-phospho-L-lactate transferase CofD family protein [Methanogenium organophilum]|uniref:2-phospho-L-lactate transferase CofD family protein n=1 Tax=Methanogenium organophilum TaxID=2199 RepID=A0A9X9S367_METOG|nr:2-phospho-L-lactate transferase CofD family protein [Methanogenium organophilum]WAI00673.1 2-phospho-L-lactate transferase CofD family protein [Methanogenium organophilum]
MITFISAGRKSARLIAGFRSFMDDPSITVITPSAYTRESPCGCAAPDIDTLTFLFAGILNTKTWQGIQGDTCTTHRALQRLGTDEPQRVGDQERALHISRAERLKDERLTNVTNTINRTYGIMAQILPATDDIGEWSVTTPSGQTSLAQYRTSYSDDTHACAVHAPPGNVPHASAESIEAIKNSDVVIVGPGRPVTGIMPALMCSGIPEVLRDVPVISFVPFTSERSMAQDTRVYTQDTVGECPAYTSFTDLYLIDIHDPLHVDGALPVDTRMGSRSRRDSLAWDIMALTEGLKKEYAR